MINLPIIYTVVGAFLILLIVQGLVFQKLNSNVSDYFQSGGRAAWWLVGVSIFMAGISAKTFTAGAGVAFEAGWSILWDYLAGAGGAFLQFLFLAHLFRQTRAITFAELVRDRFGEKTQVFYAFMTIVMSLMVAGIWLWGLAVFVCAVLGINMQMAIIVVGVVVLFYSTVGGSWSVMAADFIQGLIMLTMVILLSILCLDKLDGISGLFRHIQDAGLTEQFAPVHKPNPALADPYQYTALWAFALTLFTLITNMSMSTAVKFFSVKTGRDARKAALLTAILMVVTALLFFIPPMTARILFPADVNGLTGFSKPAEGAFAIVSMRLLPESLLGMMIVAMLAATMSSMDVALNRNAALVVRDILPKFFKKSGIPVPGEHWQMRIGQLFSVVFGVIIIWISIRYSQGQAGGVLETGLLIGSLVGIPVSIPLVMGIIVKRTPGWSAVVSVLTALIPALWAFIDGYSFGRPWPYHVRVFAILPAGIISFALTHLFWQRTPEEQKQKIECFFRRMHTPIDFEKEVGSANDDFQLRLLGYSTLSVAGFVLLLLFIPQSVSDRLLVLAVSAVFGMIGGMMLWKGRKKLRIKSGEASECNICRNNEVVGYGIEPTDG